MTALAGWMERWKARVQTLKTEVQALLLASRDPQVPWQAKVVVALVVAYAASPIDLIPDFIPVLGYLDDLIILPLGLLLALKMIPEDVMKRCRCTAKAAQTDASEGGLGGAILVLTLWGLALIGAVIIGRRWTG
jgi:uncharacterized membrane protein YkvA (DUF1232 family)